MSGFQLRSRKAPPFPTVLTTTSSPANTGLTVWSKAFQVATVPPSSVQTLSRMPTVARPTTRFPSAETSQSPMASATLREVPSGSTDQSSKAGSDSLSEKAAR